MKGKGGTLSQWRARAQAELAQVHGQMAELSQECRAVQPRAFALMVYPRQARRELRWRLSTGRHLSWAAVQPLIEPLPVALAAWYRQAQEHAQWLNARDQVLRYELRTVARLLRQRP